MQPDQDIIITVLTMEHYEAVYALWCGCEGMGLTEADSREGTEKYLLRNPGMSRVALDGDRVVGAVLVGHDGRRGYLNHLAVSPDCRRRGVGAMLLTEALEVLRADGIGKCHGLVFKDNVNGLEFWRAADWHIHEEICLISKKLPPV